MVLLTALTAAAAAVAFLTDWAPDAAPIVFGACLGALASGAFAVFSEATRLQAAQTALRPVIRAAAFEVLNVVQRHHCSFDPVQTRGDYRSGAYGEDYQKLPGPDSCNLMLVYLEDMRRAARELVSNPAYWHSPIRNDPATVPLLDAIVPTFGATPFEFLHEYVAPLAELAGDSEFDRVIRTASRVIELTVRGRVKAGYARAHEGDERGALNDWIQLTYAIDALFAALLVCGWPEGDPVPDTA